jgi:hypothetical protein
MAGLNSQLVVLVGAATLIKLGFGTDCVRDDVAVGVAWGAGEALRCGRGAPVGGSRWVPLSAGRPAPGFARPQARAGGHSGRLHASALQCLLVPLRQPT